jgi:nitroreductase
MQANGKLTEDYSSYPRNLGDPWMARRRECGGQLYSSLGIGRRDSKAREAQARRNWVAFGAPCLLIAHMPAFMGPPQWADLGAWLQTVMLLLQEEGYDSCPQGAWAYVAGAVRASLDIPEDHVVCCGLAIGKADRSHPANSFRTTRADIADTIRFVGE